MVRGSYTKGDVRAVSGGGASNRIGGLVGSNSYDGLVSNSYAAGAVSGDFETGGLIGWNDGVVAASYAVGAVDGIESAGAFIGNNTTGYVIDSYWNTDASSDRTGVAPRPRRGRIGCNFRRVATAHGLQRHLRRLDLVAGRRWDFGGADRLPTLKADIDGDGRATQDEFGALSNRLGHGVRAPGSALIGDAYETLVAPLTERSLLGLHSPPDQRSRSGAWSCQR